MDKITRQMMADDAAKRWRAQYPKGHCDASKEAIYEALAALPAGTAPNDVDAIIGNGSWTDLNCDECGAEDVDFVVRVGEDPDYESHTARLCGVCIDLLKQKF